MQTATVRYQVATYSSTIAIACDENDDTDDIVAMVKRQLVRESGGISLPSGYQQFTIVSREFVLQWWTRPEEDVLCLT